MLFPIESMTTKKWFDIVKDTKFKLYIPSYRIGFIVNEKEYKAGAFGIVIIKFQNEYEIELIDKNILLGGEE